MSCEDIPSIDDLRKAKVEITHLGEVIDGTPSGTSTNPITGKTLDTLPHIVDNVEHQADIAISNVEHQADIAISNVEKASIDAINTIETETDRILAGLGPTVLSWTFTTGGIVANPEDVVLNDLVVSSGKGNYYRYKGSFPKTVAAGFDPVTDPVNWLPTDIELRSLTIQNVDELWTRSTGEVGYSFIGSFQEGCTLYKVNDLIIDRTVGKVYSWCGEFPKTVLSGSNPDTTGGISATSWSNATLHINNNPDKQAAVIQAMVDGLPVKICIIGDSIVNGLSVTTPWPIRFGEILREWYNNPNITVIKRGYSGSDTGQVLANNMPEIIADNADLYLIALGVNDARQDRSISVDMYEDSLRTMYNRLSFAAVSFCSLTDVVGLKATAITNPYAIDAYRSRMKHIAQTCGARYIDSYSIMQRYLFKRGDARGRLSRDRLHWNQAGYDLIAEAIFMDGFAGVNLEIEPNQFIDGVTSAYRGLNNQLRTLNCPYSAYVETVASSESKLFIFNTSLKPAYLLAHFVSALSQAGVVTGQVTVKNSVEPTSRTYTLDIANAIGITTNNLSDVPTSVCDLAPGLNIVTFTTPADKTLRIVGFTAKEYPESHNVMMREKAKIGNKIAAGMLVQAGVVENTQYYCEIPFKRFGSNQSNGVNSNSDYRLPRSLCTLTPRTYGETRFRIRGCFGGNAVLNLGYQIKSSAVEQEWSADCTQMFAIDFQATITYFRITSFTGSIVSIAKVNNSSGDQCIDIITSEGGTQFYVNGVLLFNMDIKLPEVDLFFSSSFNSLAEGVVIESIAEVGTSIAPNTLVPGEKWFSHTDSKMHVVDKSGVHKTIQYI